MLFFIFCCFTYNNPRAQSKAANIEKLMKNTSVMNNSMELL
jgi:hypothetical protein